MRALYMVYGWVREDKALWFLTLNRVHFDLLSNRSRIRPTSVGQSVCVCDTEWQR